MSRLLPHPLLSLALAVMWLLLNAPVTPATLLLAGLVGWLVPFVMLALRPDAVRARAPGVILRLAGTVLVDVVRSNIDVAKVILGLNRGERRTGFVSIPLDLRDPYGLTVLSIIITGAPGTLWVQYESATGRLLLHVLDLTDGDDWVRRIKDRYERPLLEIFR
ncbi:Na+/H+ antiporter subunit E [Methylobacterium gossipiicola]|uniref:Multisubunit potassium/proton antiporter, PhaE subunit n=1 Tax=Methylobacterium gossipiicola TaxID=582675 RepID=A0A1I2VAG4_9HYPH|nr:Na+/H+ antiporter subunit E [Methylobacterium gossipiicola]SFG85167.1 multisubunit potassium/proton antiporter, PhaE subunit [Methylobacterium gossipiicola]